MSNEKTLACVTEINAVEVFTTDGIDPLIEMVKKEVSGFVPDLSTAKGRTEIASLAYKVSRSKTALDDAGKKLVAGKKAEIKVVDDARKKMRDELDGLRDEVRQPLTEWEEEEERRKAEEERIEKQRVDAIRAQIDKLEKLGDVSFRNSIDFLTKRLEKVVEFEVTTDLFQEFTEEVVRVKAKTVSIVESAISDRAEYDKEQAELERQRKEQEERDRIQREAQEKLDREREEFESKKQAEEEARMGEMQRVDAIRSTINAVRDYVRVSPTADSEMIRLQIENLESLTLNEETCHEFLQEALDTKDSVIETLKLTLESRIEHEKQLEEIRVAKEKREQEEREAEAQAAREAEKARIEASRPEREQLKQWAEGALNEAIASIPHVEDDQLKKTTFDLVQLLHSIRENVISQANEY